MWVWGIEFKLPALYAIVSSCWAISISLNTCHFFLVLPITCCSYYMVLWGGWLPDGWSLTWFSHHCTSVSPIKKYLLNGWVPASLKRNLSSIINIGKMSFENGKSLWKVNIVGESHGGLTLGLVEEWWRWCFRSGVLIIFGQKYFALYKIKLICKYQGTSEACVELKAMSG